MKCAVVVDYFVFSVKTDNPDEVIRQWLGMEPALFERFPYGINGYLQSKRFSSIIVAYNGYENEFFSSGDMGVCVSMSGAGCRAFESLSKVGFDGLFKRLFEGMAKIDAETGAFLELKKRKECPCNVSRVDVACDEKSGLLDMDFMVEKAVDLHEFNSRMTAVTDYRSKKGRDLTGHSLYIGSEKSDFRMRIYDKVLEQKQKGTDVAGAWIRAEMVMRGENARGFVVQAAQAESIGKLAGQILNDKFRFIEPDNNNISRCTVCAWWAAFVEEVESVVLWSRSVFQQPLDRVYEWLRAQVASSLTMIYKTYGWAWVKRLVDEGKERLSPKQETLIDEYWARLSALDSDSLTPKTVKPEGKIIGRAELEKRLALAGVV